MSKRDITVCLPYYSNAGMLARQLATFTAMGSKARKHLRLIVVDDGSPTPAKIKNPGALNFPVSLYRMEVDVPWNQDACRNLAVSQAETEWVLLTDIDHLVPETTMLACITEPLDRKCAYTFTRVTAPMMQPYKPHPNSWLMTAKLYDNVGGYDERYAGIYGTDAMFLGHVQRTAKEIVQLNRPLIRCPREFIPDASTTTLERKSPANTEAKRRKDAEIQSLVNNAARPVRGRFPWKRVL